MRDFTTDAALRPQPRRDGPDDWPTPPCLVTALVAEVLRELPPGPLWEPAAGSGVLVRAMQAAGRHVIASDLERDFLSGWVPPGVLFAAVVTNPPFNLDSAFLQRGLELLDSGVVRSLTLLLRHDHLQSESRRPPHCRLAALRRASLVLICPWRPMWIPNTSGNGRWSFSWVVWHAGGGPAAIRWAKKRRWR
jgi:hypothetical protein